jgi:hypothetical protein
MARTGASETREPASPPAPTAARVAAEVKAQLGELWLPEIYAVRVRTKRTRAVPLSVPARLNATKILHTLLGIELQVGRRRLSCPDLASARYLTVFARLGCKAAAMPYDITQVSHLADELESAWQRMLLLIDEAGAAHKKPNLATRVRTLLVNEIRAELEAQGAGPAIPEFNQHTRQRRL